MKREQRYVLVWACLWLGVPGCQGEDVTGTTDSDAAMAPDGTASDMGGAGMARLDRGITDDASPIVDLGRVADLGADAMPDGGATPDAGQMPEACPLPDENGEMGGPIYNHRVQWSHSDDPRRFRGQPEVLLEHASVPDGIRRPDGETWVYYMNGTPGQHGMFIARLEGQTLVPFDCVRIDGGLIRDAVDPDIVRLPDGRYRLFYFYGWFSPERRPPPGGAPHPFFSAISEDGIHFQLESQILTLDNEGTDPTAVRLPSGRWLLAATGENQVYLSTSEDGLNFAWTDHVFTQGISELAYFPDEDLVRLYIGGRERALWQSDDEGATWSQDPEGILPGPDPSVVPDGEGGWIMFYKTMTPGSGSGPMPPMPGGR